MSEERTAVISACEIVEEGLEKVVGEGLGDVFVRNFFMICFVG